MTMYIKVLTAIDGQKYPLVQMSGKDLLKLCDKFLKIKSGTLSTGLLLEVRNSPALDEIGWRKVTANHSDRHVGRVDLRVRNEDVRDWPPMRWNNVELGATNPTGTSLRLAPCPRTIGKPRIVHRRQQVSKERPVQTEQRDPQLKLPDLKLPDLVAVQAVTDDYAAVRACCEDMARYIQGGVVTWRRKDDGRLAFAVNLPRDEVVA